MTKFFLFPIILLALWQFFACSLSLGLHSFQIITFTSFMCAMLVSVWALRTDTLPTLHLTFYNWISFIGLAILATALFILHTHLVFMDAFWPTQIIGLVNQIARGHFPLSYLSFPTFTANYHQGFLFLCGLWTHFFTDLNGVQGIQVCSGFCFFYFVFLVQVLTATFSSPKWAWLPVPILFFIRSFQMTPTFFEPYGANTLLSFSDYFLSNSWPLSLCIFLLIFLFMPKSLNTYTPSRFITQHLLIFSLLTCNATLFAVERIVFSLFLLATCILYYQTSWKTKWLILGGISLLTLWLLPRYIPSAFLIGYHYEQPLLALRILEKSRDGLIPYSLFALKHLILAGPYAIVSLCLVCWVFKKNFRQSPLIIVLSMTLITAFLLPLMIDFKNINWWDNLHKFTMIWMVCALVFISLTLTNVIKHSKIMSVAIAFSLIISLFGEWPFRFYYFPANVPTEPYAATDAYDDVVAFLKHQKHIPLLYPYGMDLSHYSPALMIATFSGSFLKNCYCVNFLLSPQLEKQYADHMAWWKPESILSVAKDNYDPTWVLVKNTQLLSLETDIDQFNQQHSPHIASAEVHYFKQYVLTKLVTLSS